MNIYGRVNSGEKREITTSKGLMASRYYNLCILYMCFLFAIKLVRHEEDKTTNIKVGPRLLITEKLETGFLHLKFGSIIY